MTDLWLYTIFSTMDTTRYGYGPASRWDGQHGTRSRKPALNVADSAAAFALASLLSRTVRNEKRRNLRRERSTR